MRGELGFDLQDEVSRFCLLVDKGGSRAWEEAGWLEADGVGPGGGDVLEPEWMRE